MSIKKCRNRPVIRLPASVVEAANLMLDQKVKMLVVNGRVVIEPIAPSYRLADLVKKIDESNLHSEQDFGVPKGQELLRWKNEWKY